MKRYPLSIKAEARRLVKGGATQRTVAQKLKVSEATVSRWARAKPFRATSAAPATPAESFNAAALRVILASNALGDTQKVVLLRALLQ